ncbi:MAG: hypothetical protein Q8S18_08915 [Bacteroidales bacterium]|nr:hypothetical protein [Bacteroidales bacterium]
MNRTPVANNQEFIRSARPGKNSRLKRIQKQIGRFALSSDDLQIGKL